MGTFEFIIDFQEFLKIHLEIIPLQEALKPVLRIFGKSLENSVRICGVPQQTSPATSPGGNKRHASVTMPSINSFRGSGLAPAPAASIRTYM